ncbi:MAG: DNA cytosine methyltransferase [Candidatus Bathyarchaeia archaeon]
MNSNTSEKESSFGKKLSFADLFCGAGGLSLGFKMSGFFQPVVAVEANSVVAQTYKKNIGADVLVQKVQAITSGDLLKKAKENGYSSIQAVVGGPPCKPFTFSNKGNTSWVKIKEENEDFDHPDWLRYWEIIEGLEPKPKAVIVENVMGVKKYDEVFAKFIDRIGKYYSTTFRKLHANRFGVPQNRTRIFIAGVKDYNGDPEKILPFNPETFKKVTVKDAIRDLPELSNAPPSSNPIEYLKGRPSEYQKLMRQNSDLVYDHTTHIVHPVMAEKFACIPQGYNLRKAWIEGKIPEALMMACYSIGVRQKKFSENTLKNMHSNIYRRLKWEDSSVTITHVRKAVLIHPLQNRLISVREAARIQSFPDTYRFSGSISQQYQQIADAVPPLLAKAIALHLGRLLLENQMIGR